MDDNTETTFIDDIVISSNSDSITIVRTWSGVGSLIISVFAILWIFVFRSEFDVLFLPVLHVVISSVFAYWALASWLNKTKIFATKSKFTVSHYPIPWAGGCSFDISDVRHFVAHEKVDTVTREKGMTSYSISNEVYALFGEDEIVRVLKGLESDESALIIAESLNRFLGLNEDTFLADDSIKHV
ncbi:hypothetical protein [Aliagarivorans taiwanensis]|uniref:hypothetical protein n=1 Tax=Aliagarivorans taiwanensis TaxID=561966 RepID=UPI00047DB83B|nr:hypothetical protein [Aliagarivorans taiwanensis]